MRAQAQRCMDCGVPFCHTGCPLGNLIPDWNDLVHRGRWREAIDRAARDEQLPGVHRASCARRRARRRACWRSTTRAVTIKQIEQAIADRAWDEGWIVPAPRAGVTGRHGGRRRLGPGGAGGGAAARARGPRGDGVRARRPRRRPAALRHPRLQVRQGGARPAAGAAATPRACASRPAWRRPRRAGRRARAPASTPLVLATGAQRHRRLDLPGRDLGGRRAGHAVPDRARTAAWPACRSTPTRSRRRAST